MCSFIFSKELETLMSIFLWRDLECFTLLSNTVAKLVVT